MSLIVQKYGGTSVKDAERIKAVAAHVKATKEAGNQVVVVVSAPAGMTDNLTTRAMEISDTPSPREMDMLLSTGEQISISLLAMALHEMQCGAVSFIGSQVQILTDDTHQKARILHIDHERIVDALDNDKVAIVAGFQGRTSKGEVTTLGRGGSDTTAVAIAAAVGADLCEIYTDVDGIYTADPRIISNPSKLQQISYDEMLELASLGAKVLHPRSVEVAKMHGVALCVRSSYDTSIGGTFVVNQEELEEEYAVTGIALDKNVAKVGIFGVDDRPGIAAQIFTALADERINVDMIIQSAMYDRLNDIAFTVVKTDLQRAIRIITDLRDTIPYQELTYSDDVVKISAVGAGMVSAHGIAAKMFNTFYNKNINIDMIGTSEIKISCIIHNDEDTVKTAMQSLHDAFGLDNIR